MVADREILRIFRIKGSDPRNILELETSIPVSQEYQALGSLNCLFQRDGKIWAGTYDGIFEISNNGQFTRVLPEIKASIYQIWNDEIHDLICIQTCYEVIFMNRTGELNRIPVIEMNYGVSLAGRKMGDEYVLFIGKEVRLWNGSTLSAADISFGKKIVSGFVDRQDNLWLGFDGTGMACVKNRDSSVKRIVRKGVSASKKPLFSEDENIWLFCEPKGSELPVYIGYTKEGEPLNRQRIGYHF
jgi:ligand-binding sensor domain-containing protein